MLPRLAGRKPIEKCPSQPSCRDCSRDSLHCVLFLDSGRFLHLDNPPCPGLSHFCLTLLQGPFPVSDLISAQLFEEAKLRVLLPHLLQPSRNHIFLQL